MPSYGLAVRLIKLWDPESGRLLQTLEGHSDSVNSVAFSADGKLLASGSYDRTIKLWDTESGRLLQTLEGNSDSVNSVAFSADGKQLASSHDRTVKLWDPESGRLLRAILTDSFVFALLFSDDGSSLQTNRGCLSLQPTLMSNSLSQLNVQPLLFVDEKWVKNGGEMYLWLPPVHRSNVLAVRRGAVGLGYSSGRVMMMEFSF
jgi:WD40 repeat protein